MRHQTSESDLVKRGTATSVGSLDEICMRLIEMGRLRFESGSPLSGRHLGTGFHWFD